jgi:hypothetical protein
LGVIGTLKLDYDSSLYEINAKIIGFSLDEIKEFIDSEKTYNTFGIFLGGVFGVVGLAWVIKKLTEKRQPL